MRPIVRGKAKAAVEFGAKLDISVVDGWTRLEYHSFDAYNESKNLSDMIERYRERTGQYPEQVLADKIYRNRENIGYCSARGVRLSGPALGRPKKDEVRDKRQNYRHSKDTDKECLHNRICLEHLRGNIDLCCFKICRKLYALELIESQML